MQTAAVIAVLLGLAALWLSIRPGRQAARPPRIPAEPPFQTFLLASALLCLGLPFFVLALSQAACVLDLEAGRLVLPGSLAAALFLHLALFRRRLAPRALLASALVLALVLALGLWAGGRYFDASYDGKAYHQEAVLAFLSGYNPLTQIYPGNHWVDDYPKLSWVLAAALARWTPSIQGGKGLQFLFLAGDFLVLLRLFLSERRGGPRLSALYALALAAGPVAVCQLFSFYVDAPLFALLSVLLAQAVILARRRGRSRPPDWVLAAFAGSLCANLKFTGLVFAGAALIGLTAFAAVYARRSLFPRSAALGAAVLFLSLGLGANPYLHNLLRGHHLFHPLMGAHQVRSIIEAFRPPYMTGRNRTVNLFVSNFSQVRIIDHNPAATLRNPFDFAGRLPEFREMVVPDPRVGGFGPYMGAVLVLAGLLAGLAVPGLAGRGRSGRRLRVLRRGRGKYALLYAALILGSTLLNPEPWWARYSPQFWLFWAPAVLWLRPWRGAARRVATGSAHVLAWAILAVCLADSALTLGAVVRRQEMVTDIVRLNLEEARHFRHPAVYLAADRFALSAERLLSEQGIPFVYADRPPDHDTLLFFNEDDGFLLFDLDRTPEFAPRQAPEKALP